MFSFQRKKPVTTAPKTVAHIQKADSIGHIIQVVETSEALCFVADLFQRKFSCPPPDYPKHFVALYSIDGVNWQPVGYVNFWQRGKAYMCGGLVIDDRVYKTIPTAHRKIIRQQGGIAEKLLVDGFRMLPKCDVIWGYVGNTQARRVDLRVGFVDTHRDQVMAVWNKDFSDAEKHQLAEEISSVGPF